jgi:hypothetical protein
MDPEWSSSEEREVGAVQRLAMSQGNDSPSRSPRPQKSSDSKKTDSERGSSEELKAGTPRRSSSSQGNASSPRSSATLVSPGRMKTDSERSSSEEREASTLRRSGRSLLSSDSEPSDEEAGTRKTSFKDRERIGSRVKASLLVTTEAKAEPPIEASWRLRKPLAKVSSPAPSLAAAAQDAESSARNADNLSKLNASLQELSNALTHLTSASNSASLVDILDSRKKSSSASASSNLAVEALDALTSPLTSIVEGKEDEDGSTLSSRVITEADIRSVTHTGKTFALSAPPS